MNENEHVQLVLKAAGDANLSGRERRTAIFGEIVVKTPFCGKIETALDRLYRRTRASHDLHRAKLALGRPDAKPECFILPIVGKSHCGKSTAVKRYIHRVLPTSDFPQGSKPAVLATLSQDATIRRMWVDVLNAFGDPQPTGTRQGLENRVDSLARQHETMLLVVDECQHLTKGSGESIGDTLKKAVSRGQFSIVLVGQPQEIDLLTAEDQVANRCLATIEIGALRIENKKDREEFRGFLAYLDKKLQAYGVFQEPSRLAQDELYGPIMYASQGYVGVASKLIGLAIDQFCPAQAGRLDQTHLAAACDAYPRMLQKVGSNPFREQ